MEKFVGAKPSRLRTWSFQPPTGLLVTAACNEWLKWVTSVVEILLVALVPVQLPFSLIVSASLNNWTQVVAVGVGVKVEVGVAVLVGVKVAAAKVPVGVAVGVAVGALETVKAESKNWYFP